jgi:hypothetical protein
MIFKDMYRESKMYTTTEQRKISIISHTSFPLQEQL